MTTNNETIINDTAAWLKKNPKDGWFELKSTYDAEATRRMNAANAAAKAMGEDPIYPDVARPTSKSGAAPAAAPTAAAPAPDAATPASSDKLYRVNSKGLVTLAPSVKTDKEIMAAFSQLVTDKILTVEAARVEIEKRGYKRNAATP